jgi:anti-sigma factor RsiW
MKLFDRFKKQPMGCEEVGRLLQQYLDGHLDQGRSPKLAAHLEDCRRCGLEAETYTRIKNSLGNQQLAVQDDALARLRSFGEGLTGQDG